MIISSQDELLDTPGDCYFYKEDDLSVDFEDEETYILFSSLTKMRAKEFVKYHSNRYE